MYLKKAKDFWKDFWNDNGYLYGGGVFVALVVYGLSFISPMTSALFVSVSGGIWGGVVAAILIEESKKRKTKKRKKKVI